MERRHETRNEDADGGIDLVVFNLGALRFAVDSALIRGVADPTGTPAARAPALAALLGLARGSSTASAHAPGSLERLLRFRHSLQDGVQSPGVRIEEPVSLRRAPVDAIHPLPALLAALSKLPCVRGLVTLSTTNADDLAILLDPRRLPEEACTAPLGSCNTTTARMIDQQPQGSCAVVDRTESVRQRRALAEATERLRRSERFLDATGRIAKVGGWEMDVSTGQVRWTDMTYRIHDLSPSDDPPPSEALAFFDPEDRQLLEHRIDLAITRAEPYDLQLRMTTAKGRRIWVQTTCQPVSEGDRVTKLQGTIQDISHLKRSEEQLEFLAHHDPLTGLANRSLFRARLELCLQRAARSGAHVALLFLDLNRFKYVNDSLGHSVGDQLLERVAAALATQVRSSDTIARLGGDEFVVIMDDVGNPRFAARFARRLLGTLNQPFATETRELYVTASIGISLYPEDGTDMDTLLRHADIATYRAKENGRNGFNFYEPAMSEGAAERLRLEHELRRALARNEMLLYYQPQVALGDCSLRGVEALCRWQHPRLGLVAPDLFIPVAEDSGLIGELTAWVLEQACRQLILWDQTGFRVPRLAVNLPMREIERTDLVNRVRLTLERTGLAPDRLELEVTESMIMRRLDVAVTTLDALRALGVILALDDFGTGHSSLAHLKRLPLNRLKMDKSFVDRLGEDRDDEAIARAVIA